MAEKYEDLIKELETIIKELESNTLDLDTSIKKYQRGLEISKKCQAFLDNAKEILVNKK